MDFDGVRKMITPKRRARRHDNEKKVVQSQNINNEEDIVND